MFKLFKRVAVVFVAVALVMLGMLIADRQRLQEDLIRLHVVANSDSEEDQAVKLQVRDAIISNLSDQMKNLTDIDQAKAYLQTHLPQLEAIANRVLEEAGFSDRATISLTDEEFPMREYDTFSLPSGIYQALRIVIGEGAGQNWWCVVFPSLCYTAASEQVEDVAVSYGFSDTLADTLTLEEGYEVRFFLLDCLGRMENFFHKG